MRTLLFTLTLTVAGAGCDTKAEPKAEPTAATSSRAAQDKATEVEQAHNVANVEAATAREAEAADVEKAHKVVADKLQNDFDASVRRHNVLEERVVKLTGATRRAADAASDEVMKRQATVMADIAKLRDASGSQWDAAKQQVDTDAISLARTLDTLDASMH